MDPQQRLLLEVGYAALHEAALPRNDLSGSNTGVFLGAERPDWPFLLQDMPDRNRSIFAVTADTVSVAGGRLSFILGLHGPCVTIDTACSSALVALHYAQRSVADGDSSTAVVSSVRLNLLPRISTMLAIAGMLSPDGQCKTLDASANGYVRAEGVASAVLQSVSSDAAVATAVGSAVQHDGRSASLTAPNASAQRILLRQALASTSVASGQIKQGEMHGTGTPLGDPTEAGALAAVHGRMHHEAPLEAPNSNVIEQTYNELYREYSNNVRRLPSRQQRARQLPPRAHVPAQGSAPARDLHPAGRGCAG